MLCNTSHIITFLRYYSFYLTLKYFKTHTHFSLCTFPQCNLNTGISINISCAQPLKVSSQAEMIAAATSALNCN